MDRKISSPIILLVWAILLPTNILAAPAISSLSEAPVAYAGYMEVQGTGFGDAPGQLLVNGQPSAVASWSDTEIVGYVPPGVPSGPAEVRVSNTDGTSDPLTFEIAPWTPPGERILWQQRFDTPYFHARPVVGPDGTVYVLDLRYRLYAVAADGRVRWVVDGRLPASMSADTPIFGNTSVDVDASGNVFSAHKWYVTSLDPDGNFRWRYDIDASRRSYIVYDTKVGPDGNIYVAASHTPSAADALGVYSLEPDGTFRWNVAHPYDRTTRKQLDMVFGPGPEGLQVYFSANQNSYALALADGEEIFNNLPQVTGFAAVSAVDTTVHSSNYAYRPDGIIEWQSPIFLNGAMDIDTQGIHYATTSMVTPRMVALEVDGSVRYERALDLPLGTSPDVTTVSADGGLLFMHDIQNRMLALRSSDGVEQWRIELPNVEVSETHPNGFAQYWQRRPAFSADGGTAYYLSAVNSGGAIRQRAFLNAVAPDGADGPPDQPVVLYTMSLGVGGNGDPVLHFHDPNAPFRVTGYNVYRSADPTIPPHTWLLLAADITDQDPVTPNIQWTDATGDVSPTAVWHYQVTAYNVDLDEEGPF